MWQTLVSRHRTLSRRHWGLHGSVFINSSWFLTGFFGTFFFGVFFAVLFGSRLHNRARDQKLAANYVGDTFITPQDPHSLPLGPAWIGLHHFAIGFDRVSLTPCFVSPNPKTLETASSSGCSSELWGQACFLEDGGTRS